LNSASRAFFAQIIGAKGAVRKRIETETKTQIRIPKQGETGDIVITGSSKNSVASSRRRVEIIVLAGRNKQQFTHFLAVPMTTAVIEEFKRFRVRISTILKICSTNSSFSGYRGGRLECSLG
jgi:activating signal cointegrator complex subunit 1